MTGPRMTANWASALAIAALAGAVGFVAHAALMGERAPPAAAGGPSPVPGLLGVGEVPGSVSAAPSATGVSSCAAADCACQRLQVLDALEGEVEGAQRLLASFDAGARSACADTLAGARIEALARTSRCAEARAAAAALPSKPGGEAEYALALCAYRAKNPNEARTLARAAVADGRKAAGHLLLGMIALEASELGVAETELTEAVRLSPQLADAQYNLGVLLHRQGRYNKARAAYLAALGAEPRYHDARHQLVLLTAQAGALLEARHHLEELREATGPDDERVRTAEQRVRELSVSGGEALTLPGSH